MEPTPQKSPPPHPSSPSHRRGQAATGEAAAADKNTDSNGTIDNKNGDDIVSDTVPAHNSTSQANRPKSAPASTTETHQPPDYHTLPGTAAANESKIRGTSVSPQEQQRYEQEYQNLVEAKTKAANGTTTTTSRDDDDNDPMRIKQRIVEEQRRLEVSFGGVTSTNNTIGDHHGKTSFSSDKKNYATLPVASRNDDIGQGSAIAAQLMRVEDSLREKGVVMIPSAKLPAVDHSQEEGTPSMEQLLEREENTLRGKEGVSFVEMPSATLPPNMVVPQRGQIPGAYAMRRLRSPQGPSTQVPTPSYQEEPRPSAAPTLSHERIPTAQVIVQTPPETPLVTAPATTDIPQEAKSCSRHWKLIFIIVLSLILAVTVAVVVEIKTKDDEGSPLMGASGGNDEFLSTTLFTTLAQAMKGLEESLSTATLERIFAETTTTNSTNGSSPQALAHEWMQKDPNLLNYPLWRLQERFALACVYYSFYSQRELDNSSVMASSTRHGDWLSYSISECDWADQGSDDPCDGRYKELTLVGEVMIDGVPSPSEFTLVPPEIYLLSSLHTLQITNSLYNDTSLASLLPFTELAQLSHLTRLEVSNLRDRSFQGTLPTSLGQLTTLKFLKVSKTGVSGPIPTEIGLLTQLKDLLLQDNALTGTLPSDDWTNLSQLSSLWLERNQLRGTLPAVWGSPSDGGTGWSDIVYLDLQSNEFTGTLPVEWGRLTNLNQIKLSMNHLTGSIPSSWGAHLVNVHHLALEGLNLTGSIPAEFCRSVAGGELFVTVKIKCGRSGEGVVICCDAMLPSIVINDNHT